MAESVFIQITTVLVVAVAGGIVAQFLRQPLIVAFIAVGMLLGPSGLGMVDFGSEIDLFARLGIALLLFVLGRYGDLEDPEFIATLPLDQAAWVVSTVREPYPNRMLLHSLRQLGYRGKMVLSASNPDDASLLEQAGANRVLIPYADSARETAAFLFKGREDAAGQAEA